MLKKYQETIDNLINGNFSDYRKLIKEFTKYHLVCYIEFCLVLGYSYNDLKLERFLRKD